MMRTRTRVAIAEALMANPDGRHWGYELSRRLGIDSGTMYPTLKLMLDKGWLADGWEKPGHGRAPRRYYQVTSTGKTELAELAAPGGGG